MNKLAPIVLFVYNRPEHTKKTLKALQENNLACDSKLFIYSDASKDENSLNQVNEVRELIDNVTGFKNVIVFHQESNQGLANSIIHGVTEIVNQYEKVIVLEDDLITSPYFLTYMNDALNFYENEDKVWHISAWNYPITKDGLGDVFFWRVMNCWGWATWQDRWQHFEKNTEQLIDSFSSKKINYFNLDASENFWGQVLSNNKGTINTWAIYWYATIFNRDGLCVNPTQTFIDNIGHDNSGVHCKSNKKYSDTLNLSSSLIFSEIECESTLAVSRIKKHLKKSIFFKIKDKMRHLIK